MKNNKVKKCLTAIGTLSILAVGMASTTMSASAGGTAINTVIQGQEKAFEIVTDSLDIKGPYKNTITLLETRGKQNGNGHVYMIDEISFDVSDDGKKVEKSTVSVKQSCDGICYFAGGTEYVRTNSDGSVVVSSTYYTKDFVTGFISIVTGTDIPFGMKYSKTIYYHIKPNGWVSRLDSSKGEMSLEF